MDTNQITTTVETEPAASRPFLSRVGDFFKDNLGIVIMFAFIVGVTLWYILARPDDHADKGEQALYDRLDSITSVLRSEIRYSRDSVIDVNLKSAAAQMQWIEETPFKIIKERTKYETKILSVDTARIDELIKFIEDRERSGN